MSSENYIILVSHDSNFAGASHYLYVIFNILKKKYPTIVFLILVPNVTENLYNVLAKKYNINSKYIICYNNDENILFKLYKKFNPLLFYLNSINKCFVNFQDIIKEKHILNIIFHSHETEYDYRQFALNIPYIVVTKRICNTYYNLYNKTPLVQVPILNNIDNILKLSNEGIDEISNNFGVFDKTKVTIGMCGSLTSRKNPYLFFRLASFFPQYNFLWIGGHKKTRRTIYENTYHIKNVLNPYKYFNKCFDYFLLTSTCDPCPYVILENILLETQIITFDKNIHYNHTCELLNNIYYHQPGEVCLNNCIKVLSKLKLIKKDKRTGNGYQYISKFFMHPKTIFNIIDKKLLETN